MHINFDEEIKIIKNWSGVSTSGIVTQIIGLLIESTGPMVHLGELCLIFNQQGEAIPCEVVGFKDNNVLLMSLGEMTHIAPGSEVYPTKKVLMIPVTTALSDVSSMLWETLSMGRFHPSHKMLPRNGCPRPKPWNAS